MQHNDHPRLSVVMPAYNEERTLDQIVRRVLELPCLFELIIVDDGSTDATTEIGASLAEEDARVNFVRKDKNSGKTDALRTAFRICTGDIVVIQDADLEYDPADIPDLIDPIVQGHADVVFGSRFMVKRAARVLYFYHYVANKWLTFFSNCLTNINLTDIETGYKAFRGEIIRAMRIRSSGFGFEVEVTANVAKLGCAIYEVPINYYGRTYEEGKKIGFLDCVAAVWYVAKCNLLVGLRQAYVEVPELTRPAPRRSLPVRK